MVINLLINFDPHSSQLSHLMGEGVGEGKNFLPPLSKGGMGDFEELTTDHLSLATVSMNLEKTEIWITTEKQLEFKDGRAIRGYFCKK